MKTWTFSDKTQWPVRGEWDSEPDKAQWKDEATGLDCMAVRAHGHWCGYVGVPPEHPLYQKSYDDYDMDVHGGITFASLCDPRGHSDTEARICHVAEPGEPDHLWWIGFDCAHSGDLRPATEEYMHQINLKYPAPDDYEYRTFNYVRHECSSLAAQVNRFPGDPRGKA